MSLHPSLSPRHLLALGALALALACGGGGASSTPTPGPAGPSITTAPTAQAGYAGDTVTYHVVAAGSGLSYQWLRNGTAIPGATTNAYVLPVLVADDQAHFSVRVTASAGGSTTSSEAILDVLYADPAVVAGHDHALAITTKGKVYAWGVGGNGQLGLGDYQPRTVPTAVPLPGPAVQVAAGWGHSLALLTDGRVFAWGNNTTGQLGDGTTTMRNAPAAVPGLSGVVFAICGYNHNFVVKSDNSIWVWGYNSHGQLGLGDYANRSVPTPLGFSAATLEGAALGELHSLLVGSNGELLGCGDNGYGQLGRSNSPAVHYLTFTSLLSGGVKSARAFSLFSVLLGLDGQPYGSGENVYGQLGDGSQTTRYAWVPMGTGGLPVGTTLRDVVPGQYHTLFLGTQGSVASVGYNWYGQLGLGAATTTSYSTSQGITGLNALQVSTGFESSYALLPDLTVKAWGYNANGRLGDGTATDRPSPTTVPGLFLGPLPTGVAAPLHVSPTGLGAKARPILE
jgi:alpha-tubulin suppressor-like RCC1 family protein